MGLSLSGEETECTGFAMESSCLLSLSFCTESLFIVCSSSEVVLSNSSRSLRFCARLSVKDLGSEVWLNFLFGMKSRWYRWF